jgi:hypothetical protein
MAMTGIHFDGYDEGAPRFSLLCAGHPVEHRSLAVHVAPSVCLYLPSGPPSAIVARQLAAVLLEAADAFERAAAPSETTPEAVA